MPKLGPTKRKYLIYYLKKTGFDGPYSGGKHQFMIRDKVRLVLPNPHHGEIGKGLLNKILQQAGILREEWENYDIRIRNPLAKHLFTGKAYF